MRFGTFVQSLAAFSGVMPSSTSSIVQTYSGLTFFFVPGVVQRARHGRQSTRATVLGAASRQGLCSTYHQYGLIRKRTHGEWRASLVSTSDILSCESPGARLKARPANNFVPSCLVAARLIFTWHACRARFYCMYAEHDYKH